MKVAEVYKYIDWNFPFLTAADFDNVGLMLGDMNADVTKVLITLDCTKAAVKKAIECGAEVIVSHHPLIFNPLNRIEADSVINDCIKNNIAVISAHTNVDTGKGGINDCICALLGIKSVGGIYVDSFLIRKGTLEEPLSADEFAALCKEKFGTHVKYTDGGKKISRVAVCSGSGGSFLPSVLRGEVDAFITGEVKHSDFILAANKNFSLFECGHFETEDIILPTLEKILKGALPEIECVLHHGTEIKNI